MTSPGTQSIQRAIMLLQLIGMYHSMGISINDLVQKSGLNRTTVHRILQQLVKQQLVYKDPKKPIYFLGIEVAALGSAAMEKSPLLHLYKPMVNSLVAQTKASAFLVIRSGDYGHCLYYKQGEKTDSTFASNLGRTRLLGLGISSMTLLAHLNNADIQAHYERHSNVYSTHRMSYKKMMEWVEKTRKIGFAYINAQGIGGVGQRFSIGSSGDASVSVVVPNRLDQKQAALYIRTIHTALAETKKTAS